MTPDHTIAADPIREAWERGYAVGRKFERAQIVKFLRYQAKLRERMNAPIATYASLTTIADTIEREGAPYREVADYD